MESMGRERMSGVCMEQRAARLLLARGTARGGRYPGGELGTLGSRSHDRCSLLAGSPGPRGVHSPVPELPPAPADGTNEDGRGGSNWLRGNALDAVPSRRPTPARTIGLTPRLAEQRAVKKCLRTARANLMVQLQLDCAR